MRVEQKAGYEVRYMSKDELSDQLREFGSGLMATVMDNVETMLANPGEGHDSHTGMVNSAAMAMHEGGFTSFAVDLYYEAIRRTLRFRGDTGQDRHAGALMTNVGVLHFDLGNLDDAVIMFLKAAEEDKRTHGNDRDDTFVFRDVWRKGLREPFLADIFPFLQSVEPEADFAVMDAELTRMDEYDLAFVAYAWSLRKHLRVEGTLSNVFSDIRVLSGLRDMCALLEIRLKEVAGSGDTMLPAIKALYKGKKDRYDTFDRVRKRCGAYMNSPVPNEEQVRRALAKPRKGTRVQRFRKSLVVAYAVRNYTVHKMDLGGPLIDRQTARAVFGHLLNVFTHLQNEKERPRRPPYA